MRRRPRIELPDKREDELPVRSLIAVSIACMAAGLSVAYAIADRGAAHEQRLAQHDAVPSASSEAHDSEPPPPAVEPEPSATATPPAPEPTTPAIPAQTEPMAQIVEPAVAEPDAAVAAIAAPVSPATEPAEPAEPAEPTGEHPPETGPPPGSARLEVKPGLVAYLRCEGLPVRRGPYPCPRDRDLETRMRAIVETLPNCREAHAITRGAYDVRIELGASGAVQDLAVRAPNEGAEHAVRACAAAAFRKERTELRPTRMIVSMRFKAR